MKRLPAIAGSNLLPMNTVIAVGFGDALLLRNDKVVWRETPLYEYTECLSVKQAETMASLHPGDWQIHFIGPLSEAYYQRQGEGQWVLYRQGEGFA